MEKYQKTVAALRTIIASKDATAHGRLPTERELCSVVGVGRRMLRRALDALEKDGLIVRQQGRGTFVAQALPSPSRQPCDIIDAPLSPIPSEQASWLSRTAGPMDQIELKFALEPVMARLAATRASQLDVERLRRAATACEEAQRPEQYQHADRAFHKLIAELSRNTLFRMLHEGVAEAMRDAALERFAETGRCFKRKADHIKFHYGIVDAIANRDGDEAARLMHDHLRDVYQSLLIDNIPATVGFNHMTEGNLLPSD